MKIDAKNINMTGNVDIVGTFKTSSYGKRVAISGGDIKFHDDYGNYRGSINVSDRYGLRISGANSTRSYIRLDHSNNLPYLRMSPPTVYTSIGGGLSVTTLQTLDTYAMTLEVERNIKNRGDTVLMGDVQLGEYISLVPSGSGQQLKVVSKYYEKKFIIDFAYQKTFWV